MMELWWCKVLIIVSVVMVSETVFSAQQQSTMQFQNFLNHRSYKTVMESPAMGKHKPEPDKTASHSALESYRRTLESYRRALQFDEQSEGTRFREILRQLREAGADAGAVDCQRQTVLHSACLWKLNEIVRDILDDPSFNKSVLNKRDHSQRTPLHYALEVDASSQVVSFLDHELIKKLMTQENVKMRDAMGNSLIVHALKDLKLVDLFVELGFVVPNASVDLAGGMNIFHYAAYNSAPGVIAALRRLVTDQATLGRLLNERYGGQAPLHIAAMNLRHDAIKELIDCGASINQADDAGHSALWIYLQNLRDKPNQPLDVLETVKLLADGQSGLIKNNNDSLSPYSIVFTALEEDNQHALFMGIKNYFDMVIAPADRPPSGQAPAMVESKSERVNRVLNVIDGSTSSDPEKIVKKLNELFGHETTIDLDLNLIDSDGATTTPLIKLVKILHNLDIDAGDAVQLFIDKGALAMSQDSNNKLALHYALERPLVEASKALINAMKARCFEGLPSSVEVLFAMFARKLSSLPLSTDSCVLVKASLEDAAQKYNGLMHTMLEKIADTKQERAIEACWKNVQSAVEKLPAGQLAADQIAGLVKVVNEQKALVRDQAALVR